MNIHSFCRFATRGRRIQLLCTSYRYRNMARRGGSVMFLVAVGIVVFLGAGALAVDYGLLVNDKNVMQRACDAAALAGASRLKLTNDAYDTAQASALAIDVAGRNGARITAANINFLDDYRTIRVSANTTRSLFFARFLGRTHAAVAANATATVKGIDKLTTGYVKPIGITWETYNAYKNDLSGYHDLVLIRQNKEVFEQDDFVLFDLRDQPSKSGAKMLSQLIGSDQEEAAIGDFETTLNASLASEGPKLMEGIDILIERAKLSPWFDNGPDLPSFLTENDTYNPSPAYLALINGTMSYDNPRVLTIIITPSTTNPKNGTFNTEIQGFVPVYVEGYYETASTEGDTGEDTNTNGNGKKKGKSKGNGNGGGNDLMMRVRFLPPAAPLPGQGTTTTGGALSGIRTVSLIE